MLVHTTSTVSPAGKKMEARQRTMWIQLPRLCTPYLLSIGPQDGTEAWQSVTMMLCGAAFVGPEGFCCKTAIPNSPPHCPCIGISC